MENYLKAYIIAEIGSNWEGNLSIAKKIIRECKRIGVDAIKFQMWRASDLYSENHPDWKIIKKSSKFSPIFFAKLYKSICVLLKVTRFPGLKSRA